MPTSLQWTTRSSFLTQDFQRSIRRIHPLGHYKSSKYQNVLLRKKSRVFERHLKCIFQVLFHDAFTFSKAPLLHISTTTIISFFPPKRLDSRVKRTKIFLVFLQLRCFKHGNFSQIVTYFHESKVSYFLADESGFFMLFRCDYYLQYIFTNTCWGFVALLEMLEFLLLDLLQPTFLRVSQDKCFPSGEGAKDY